MRMLAHGRCFVALLAFCLSLSGVLTCFARDEDPAAAGPSAWLEAPSADEVSEEMRRSVFSQSDRVLERQLQAPVGLWSTDCLLAIDEAYTGEGIRYLVLKLAVVNRTEADVTISRDQIVLHADQAIARIGQYPSRFGKLPVLTEFDSTPRPPRELATPATVTVPPGGAARFWCVFAGFDTPTPIPRLRLEVGLSGGNKAELDLNSQQAARLGLSSEFVGPADSILHSRISGRLNRVNAQEVADLFEKQFANGAQRAIIEWSSDAPPADEQCLYWLMNSTGADRSDNPLFLQLPPLPPLRRLALAQLPTANREIYVDADSGHKLYAGVAEAGRDLLRDIVGRLSPAEAQRQLDSNVVWVQQSILELASERLGPQAAVKIREFTRHPHAEVRQAAIFALGQQPDRSSQDLLLEILAQGDPADRRAVIRALFAAESASSRALLKDILRQPPADVPPVALVELAQRYFHPDWSPFLTHSLSDADPEVRRAALLAVQKIGHPDLTQLCIRALEDESPAVRRVAFGVLSGRRDSRSEHAALEFALQELRSGHTSSALFDLLERSREPRAAPLLLERLGDAEADRLRIITVVGEIGSDSAIRELVRRFDEWNSDEKSAVLQLVNHLGVEEQLAIVDRVLAAPEATLRFDAIEILRAIDDRKAATLLVQMLGEAPDEHFELLCSSLGEIGTVDAYFALRETALKTAAANQRAALSAALQGLREWMGRSPGWDHVEYGMEYSAQERWSDAVEAYSLAIEIDPLLAIAYSYRGNARLRLDRFDAAGADFADAYRLNPFDGDAVTGIAIVWAYRGDWKNAIRFAEDNRPLQSTRDDLYLYNTACIYGRAVEFLQRQPATPEREQELGRLRRSGIDKLRQSLALGFDQIDWMQRDPDLAPLRKLPEFTDLLRKAQTEDAPAP